MGRFNRYSTYIKERYGARVQKLVLDGGFTCPNRDGSRGTGGCIYCNNDSFSPVLRAEKRTISEQIDAQIAELPKRFTGDHYIAYFQPYSNTYAPLPRLKALYEEALAHPRICALSIATRPDCIDKERLAYLAALSAKYDVTIEYGVESLSDDTLKRINRGHTAQEFYDAVNLTAEFGLRMGVHLIVGFPWEDKDFWQQSALELSRLPIHYLKIHQLSIVRDTPLARLYLKEPFPLLEREAYLEVLVGIIERIRPCILIERLFSHAPPRYLVSPHWVDNISKWNNAFERLLEKQDTCQGALL